VPTLLRHDADDADHRARVVAPRHGQSDKFTGVGERQPPPLAWRRQPVEEVQLVARGRVDAVLVAGARLVRVEGTVDDPPQDVEDLLVVGLLAKSEPAGPRRQPVGGRPPVPQPLDERRHPGPLGDVDAGLTGGTHVGPVPPARRQEQAVLDVDGGFREQLDSGVGLPVDEVEPVERDRRTVVRPTPPGRTRDGTAVTQSNPRPLGPVLVKGGELPVVPADALEADERGIGQ
jgi:hypothetical protein